MAKQKVALSMRLFLHLTIKELTLLLSLTKIEDYPSIKVY